MVRISTVRQSDPITGVGTASPTDPVSSTLKRYKGRKRKQQQRGGFLTSLIKKIGTRQRVHKRRRR